MDINELLDVNELLDDLEAQELTSQPVTLGEVEEQALLDLRFHGCVMIPKVPMVWLSGTWLGELLRMNFV